MTNLQAAVGLAQFEKIEKHLKLKRKIGNYYLKNLNNIQSIILPTKETIYSVNIFLDIWFIDKKKFSFVCR